MRGRSHLQLLWAPGQPLPHAVLSVSGGTISSTFTYDPDGNQTSGLGRDITYTSYNKPSSITEGARTISFLDGTDHQRFKQITPEGTTLYIAAFGVLAEFQGPGTTSPVWTDYLSVGNQRVGMRVLQTATNTLTTRYFHTDNLGSISVITDENGVVQERLSYDAWGKRRYPDGTDDPTDSITSQTTRGFTGQEELSVSGLVHLNGRVYDPLLARFTSADPTVTDPTNMQSWNRYSYVGNDPLAFTDPNGFSWLSSFFDSVGHAIGNIANFLTHNPIVRAILQIAATAILTVLLPVAGGGAVAALNASLDAFGGSVIANGLAGGNLGQILRAGAIAAVTAFAFYEVGSATNAMAGVSPDAPHITPGLNRPGAYAFNIAGHAAIGCASSVASGAQCGPGALSGAVGSALSPLTTNVFPHPDTKLADLAGATALEATAGGLASVAGGGKFENGAITGAFGYLFNSQGGRIAGRIVGGLVGEALGLGPEDPGADVAAVALGKIGGDIGDAITGPDVPANVGPGPYAGEPIPAGPSPTPTADQQGLINEAGEANGCHTCGTTNPGTRSLSE